MTTKSLVLILALFPFLSLRAQTAVEQKNYSQPEIAFESVSFATEHGDILITCENADLLTDFEISAEDANLDFGWKPGALVHHFPMKLGIKPGDVTIRYTKKGEKPKIVRLKLVSKEEVKLTI